MHRFKISGEQNTLPSTAISFRDFIPNTEALCVIYDLSVPGNNTE
jgi:hypothetical protein